MVAQTAGGTNQYSLVNAERARVSREIHDTLLQSLAAIGVELETIATQLDSSQGSARDGLRRLRRQVGHCLREARESILELRHNAMKPRAFIDSLRDVADKTTARGVRTEITTTGRPRACSSETEIQLFRIGQEAVNNAVRHGHARNIGIAVAYGQSELVLTVADDGCGFTVNDHDPAPAAENISGCSPCANAPSGCGADSRLSAPRAAARRSRPRSS